MIGIAAGVLLVLVLAGAGLWHYNTGYSVTETPAPEKMPAPFLPDISGYTTDAVKALVPERAAGEVELRRMETSTYFDYMALNSMIPDFAEWQDQDNPVSIEIKSGVYDMPALVAALNNDGLIEKAEKGWLVKKPIIIHPGATLIVSGADNALRMSAQAATFLSNFGNLFIIDTTVTGWRENKNLPALYEDEKTFRPYIAVWSGSKTWMASSEFISLGYNAAKAYGVTFSTSAKMLRVAPDTPRPTGWLVDSFFKDIYYGFYSYEADDVVIVRNKYEDNVIYGIDPHDDSRRLIIAENDSYGARKKHGIIISRHVNDSWIFNNHSHDNAGAGIMLERNCRNNVIANNISRNNGSDGLVFFESPDNVSWQNRLENNGKNGVRIRNSTNIILRGDSIANNGAYGVEAYAISLAHQKTRDINIDPYEERVGYDIVDAVLANNKSGHFQGMNIDLMRLSNIKMLKSYRYFRGDLEKYESALSAGATDKNKMIMIKANNYKALPATGHSTRE